MDAHRPCTQWVLRYATVILGHAHLLQRQPPFHNRAVGHSNRCSNICSVGQSNCPFRYSNRSPNTRTDDCTDGCTNNAKPNLLPTNLSAHDCTDGCSDGCADNAKPNLHPTILSAHVRPNDIRFRNWVDFGRRRRWRQYRTYHWGYHCRHCRCGCCGRDCVHAVPSERQCEFHRCNK